MDYTGSKFGKPAGHKTQRQRRAKRKRVWNKSGDKKRERSGGICPECGKPGLYLHGHHKKHLKMGGSNLDAMHDPETNQDMECVFCHGKDHKIKNVESEPKWSRERRG